MKEYEAKKLRHNLYCDKVRNGICEGCSCLSPLAKEDRRYTGKDASARKIGYCGYTELGVGIYADKRAYDSADAVDEAYNREKWGVYYDEMKAIR